MANAWLISMIWRVAMVGTEIDGGADSGRAHVVGFLDGAEQNLVELVRVGQQFVVIDLHDEGNLVRVLARDGTQHAERGGDGVAAALDGQLDDIFAVEIIRILREAGARRMLDTLIDRENGHIAGAAEPPVEEQAVKIVQDAQIAIGHRIDAVDKIGAGKMQPLLGNFGILEAQQAFCLCS